MSGRESREPHVAAREAAITARPPPASVSDSEPSSPSRILNGPTFRSATRVTHASRAATARCGRGRRLPGPELAGTGAGGSQSSAGESALSAVAAAPGHTWLVRARPAVIKHLAGFAAAQRALVRIRGFGRSQSACAVRVDARTNPAPPEHPQTANLKRSSFRNEIRVRDRRPLSPRTCAQPGPGSSSPTPRPSHRPPPQPPAAARMPVAKFGETKHGKGERERERERERLLDRIWPRQT